ncbi:MAG: hydroxymethylglutaryl-CoA lyase [Alphaproteobacteria bacterium]|nr:MAG: hydroxymethylglutaryl-CoA lyase [Alphaproteobacteria bacterium]
MSNSQIEIVEVGVRDGLQNDPSMLSTELKLEFIRRLVASGIRRLEAASFVNPKLVPQMADSAAVMAEVPRQDGVRYIGLALNARGLEAALDALCDEVNYVVPATDAFGRRNQNATTEECLETFAKMVGRAKETDTPCSVTITTSFGCPFEGEVPVARVVDVAARAAEIGACEIAIADTIGVATPWDVRERVKAVSAEIAKVPLRLHVHNTRNTGIANAYAAVEEGVRIIDASCGGIGGCPFAPKATGNIATEDLAYMLTRAGFDTGIDLAALLETSKWLESAVAHPIPGLVAKAGLFPAA